MLENRRIAAVNKTALVGRVVALFAVGQWVFFQVLLRNWDRVEVAARFFLGNDYADLYTAAGYVLSGTSPYADRNIITPPPSLFLPMALHRLPFWDAYIAFRTINLILVLGALLWLCRQLRINALNAAFLVVICLTYAPFYSILAGGNLDGLMMVLLVFSCARDVASGGAFLGLSIVTKVYSVLALPVLLLRRRWREAAWAIGIVLVLLLPFVHYLPDFVFSLQHRSARLRLDGNQSPAVLFILLFGQEHVWLWRSCYVLLWGGTLLIRMVADWTDQVKGDDERFRVLQYLPWMAAAPLLVFTYTSTILLPLMALLIQKNQERRLSWGEWLTVAGFLLTGSYPVVLSALVPAGKVLTTATVITAPLGISAMLIGSAAAAFGPLKLKHSANTPISAVAPQTVSQH